MNHAFFCSFIAQRNHSNFQDIVDKT